MKNARNINSGHEAIRDQFTCIVNLPKELYLIDVIAAIGQSIVYIQVARLH